jgi:spore maturation protein CgeB
VRSPPFAGLRVVLVAAFNRRYHRSGLALAAALESLGCEVWRCEERQRGLDGLLRRPLHNRLRAMLARRPTDLVLVFKGTNLGPSTIADLRGGTRARWACWFPDDPHELDVSVRLSPSYDWFFTHDTSSLDRHRSGGARAYYLAFGCDPDYFTLPEETGPRATRLVFVGSRDPARERVVHELGDLGLETWGPAWPNGAVYGSAFVRTLARAHVGLNIHQQFGTGDLLRYGTGANMRVFELAAVGTPQLSDAKADIARHFTPDREIVLYRTIADLRERAGALLADGELRRSLAERARARALAEHTWAIRLQELLSVTLR